MLGFDGVMEIVFSDIVVLVIEAGDPQPVIDIKAIGRAREQSLTKLCNEFVEFMLALRRCRSSFEKISKLFPYRRPEFPAKSVDDQCTPFPRGIGGTHLYE
jgi:hypothetical protein